MFTRDKKIKELNQYILIINNKKSQIQKEINQVEQGIRIDIQEMVNKKLKRKHGRGDIERIKNIRKKIIDESLQDLIELKKNYFNKAISELDNLEKQIELTKDFIT